MKKTRKILSLLLCAALLLCWLALSASAVTAGDVDGDGSVTSADARLALRASVKLETLSEDAAKAADADRDGKITSADARLILRASVKLETLPEIEESHEHNWEWVVDTAPTCGATGMKHQTCPVCGASQSESTPIEATGEHNWEWVIDIEPTYEKPGKKHQKCIICGAMQNENTEEKYAVVMVTDGGEAKDDGFNQVVYDSAKAVCEANDAVFAVRAAASDEPEALAAAIDAAVEAGADVLVLPGFMFAPAIQQTVGKYPEVKFIAVDVSADDFGEGFELPDNFYCAVYQEELCGYMAGFAAVKLGYTKLGFLGGMAFPSVMRYGYGFVQGADAAAAELGKTDVTVKFGYAGQFFPDDELTEAMMDWYGSGTQVVFACGGGIYGSVAGAAKETGGGKLIGVDVDQAKLIAQAAASRGGNEEDYMDMTVTSAVKNHGATVALALKAVFAGKFDAFGGRSDRLGVISADPEENAVQLAASTQFGDGFTKEDYAALTAKLFNGELTVDDDVEKAPADFATVITVEDVGNVK